MDIRQLLNPERDGGATGSSGAMEYTAAADHVRADADGSSDQEGPTTIQSETALSLVSPAGSSSVDNSRLWTKKEYEILLRRRQLDWDWERLSQPLPGRSAEQCRERWENPRPVTTKVHPNWAPEEERILVARKRRGQDWAEIANYLPARTIEGCKNRWYEKHYNAPPKPKPWWKSL